MWNFCRFLLDFPESNKNGPQLLHQQWTWTFDQLLYTVWMFKVQIVAHQQQWMAKTKNPVCLLDDSMFNFNRTKPNNNTSIKTVKYLNNLCRRTNTSLNYIKMWYGAWREWKGEGGGKRGARDSSNVFLCTWRFLEFVSMECVQLRWMPLLLHFTFCSFLFSSERAREKERKEMLVIRQIIGLFIFCLVISEVVRLAFFHFMIFFLFLLCNEWVWHRKITLYLENTLVGNAKLKCVTDYFFSWEKNILAKAISTCNNNDRTQHAICEKRTESLVGLWWFITGYRSHFQPQIMPYHQRYFEHFNEKKFFIVHTTGTGKVKLFREDKQKQKKSNKL